MAATVSTATTTEAEIARLAEHYAFRDPEAVAGFVRAHPEVVAPLLDAVAVVPRFFGSGTPLVLDVVREPEAHDHTQLFALIQTDLDAISSLAALDRFDQEWWLDMLLRANRNLIFSLEYV